MTEADGTDAGPQYRRLRSVPALDGLRGIAVILIILAHTEEVFLLSWVTHTAGRGVFQGGAIGVDLFFALSGFLITAVVLKEEIDRGHARMGSFYVRRAMRLLPALFVLLAIHAVYAMVTHLPKHVEIATITSAVFYYLNWYWANGNVIAQGLSNLWTLAVEEQFYLVWPTLLILFFGLKRRTMTVTIVLTAAAAAVVIHRIMLWNDGASIVALFVRTDTRADSLIIGALLGQLWVRRRTPTHFLGLAAWAAALFFVFGVIFFRPANTIILRPTNGFLYLGGFTLVDIAVVVVILATVEGRWIGTRFLAVAPLRVVGKVSYGLYLWHLALFAVVARYCNSWPTVWQILFAWSLSAVFTVASWNIVERPFRLWKDRLTERDRQRDQVASFG